MKVATRVLVLAAGLALLQWNATPIQAQNTPSPPARGGAAPTPAPNGIKLEVVDGTRATYRVQEQLAGVNFPNDADGSTTVVTGTFDGTTGEFNFAYAAHPRMLLWQAREEKFAQLGDGLENFPLGYITGEQYNEQSVRLLPGADAVPALA